LYGAAVVRDSLLALIACPDCKGALELRRGVREPDGHVLEGELGCAGCGAGFPIRRGVPRLLRTGASREQATARRFGAQWKIFSRLAPYQEQKLLEWIHPFGRAELAGRVVYEAGCGKGRHSVVVAEWGARALVALDLSDAVEVAFEHTREWTNAHVAQGDLLDPPLRRAFDVAFSVGVLHHLPAPRAGFEALTAPLVDGGRVLAWVYGHESNEWVVRYVDPLRTRLTSRLPEPLLYWLTLPPALGLRAASQLYASERLAARLPMRGYLSWLRQLPLVEVHNIVFDQLTPPVTHYLPEGEVRSWVAPSRFSNALVTPFRDNSWRVSARLSPRAQAEVEARAPGG
jgi:uncharacterized protein YbaR (Trm112 family)